MDYALNPDKTEAGTYVELNILLTIPVSIMHVNNETGNIQPVQEMGDYLLDKDVFSCRCNAKSWKTC